MMPNCDVIEDFWQEFFLLNVFYSILKQDIFPKVGLGEAGKTSLLHALMNDPSYKIPAVTDGIDIREWNVPLPDSTELVYSMWDFGNKISTII